MWEALLETDMPMTALIRNLATLTRVGLLAPGSEATRHVVAQLGDAERLRAARIHPIAVLAALKTYAQGKGERGKATWEPVPQVVDALDAAFYASFGNVEPTGKRWLLALDVSGSMGGGMVAGVPGLTPRVASAAMALITAATEPAPHVPRLRARAGAAGDQPAPAPGRRGRGRQQPPVRRHRLRAADAVGDGAQGEGRCLRGLHRQRDVVRQDAPGAGAAAVPRADGHPRPS